MQALATVATSYCSILLLVVLLVKCIVDQHEWLTGVPRARRSNVQFDVEESPIIGEGSLKSTSWARKPTSNRSTFDVQRSPDLKPSDHAGVVMDADVQYKEEQVGCGHVFVVYVSLQYAVRHNFVFVLVEALSSRLVCWYNINIAWQLLS